MNPGFKEAVPGRKAFFSNGDVYLESSHVVIRKAVAEQIFGVETAGFSVFYPAEKTLLAAPASEENFRQIHTVTQVLLKTRNAAGDLSIAVHDLLLDHDIDDGNRNLEFTAEPALRILKVKL